MSAIGAIGHATSGSAGSINKATSPEEEEQKKKANPEQLAFANSIFGNQQPPQASGFQA